MNSQRCLKSCELISYLQLFSFQILERFFCCRCFEEDTLDYRNTHLVLKEPTDFRIDQNVEISSLDMFPSSGLKSHDSYLSEIKLFTLCLFTQSNTNVNFLIKMHRPFLMAVWFKVLPLTANCLSPLNELESHLGACAGFLNQLQLASHNKASDNNTIK